jgi:hypothetical protein
MTTQAYLIIENNVVTNNVMWDGGPDWAPPTGSIALVQATTPAMIWQISNGAYVLTQVVGAGDMGFTWNGTVLTTNQPQPVIQPQPVTTGTKTI